MSFNKLVRDKIPEIIRNEGRECKYRILSDEDYYRELKIKLNEEVKEFQDSEEVEELADILEVIYSLAKAKKYSEEELNAIRKNKADKRGAFDKKIFLEK